SPLGDHKVVLDSLLAGRGVDSGVSFQQVAYSGGVMLKRVRELLQHICLTRFALLQVFVQVRNCFVDGFLNCWTDYGRVRTGRSGCKPVEQPVLQLLQLTQLFESRSALRL